jgi:hypothetical protein
MGINLFIFAELKKNKMKNTHILPTDKRGITITHVDKQETLEDIVSDYDVMPNIRYGDNVGKRIKIKATIKSINLEEHKQSVQEYERKTF